MREYEMYQLGQTMGTVAGVALLILVPWAIYRWINRSKKQ